MFMLFDLKCPDIKYDGITMTLKQSYSYTSLKKGGWTEDWKRTVWERPKQRKMGNWEIGNVPPGYLLHSRGKSSCY